MTLLVCAGSHWCPDERRERERERAVRARTVPSTLGSLESSPGSVTDLTGSSHNTTTHPPTPVTPSALKKTVTLLSPEVLTNWYEKRKKDSAYGPRRNSISNLFFQDKKQSSPGLRAGNKLRGSMLNLEEILAGEGVLSIHRSGKGIQRSESAKLTGDSKLEVVSPHLYMAALALY